APGCPARCPAMSETVQAPVPFREALKALEQISRQLEDGDTGLEEALAQYEKGVGLLNLCYGQLRAAETRIQILTGATLDGQPVLDKFEHIPTLELKHADKAGRGRKLPES